MSTHPVDLFPPAEMARIEDTAIDAALFDPHHRALLMQGLPPRLWGSFALRPDAIAQLRSDLATLNALPARPGSDEPPIAVWLDNAARQLEVTARPGAERFHRWAATARRHAASRPAAGHPASLPVNDTSITPDPDTPTPPPTLAELLAAGAADRLADAFAQPDEARALLLAAGVPIARVPPMNTSPRAWWTDVLARLDAGLAPLAPVLRMASDQYPHNTGLRHLADRFQGSATGF